MDIVYLIEKMLSCVIFFWGMCKLFQSIFESEKDLPPPKGRYLEIISPTSTESFKIPVTDHFRLTNNDIRHVLGQKIYLRIPRTVLMLDIDGFDVQIYVKRGIIKVNGKCFGKGSKLTIKSTNEFELCGTRIRYIAIDF